MCLTFTLFKEESFMLSCSLKFIATFREILDVMHRLRSGDINNDILVIFLEDLKSNNGNNNKVAWWRQHL